MEGYIDPITPYWGIGMFSTISLALSISFNVVTQMEEQKSRQQPIYMMLCPA
jgi:hypothetical protein